MPSGNALPTARLDLAHRKETLPSSCFHLGEKAKDKKYYFLLLLLFCLVFLQKISSTMKEMRMKMEFLRV